MNRILLGKEGEARARKYLQKKGYTIVTQNYRCRFGEIDLIVEKEQALIFIEVRYRHSTDYGLPQETVIKRKQARIKKAATLYLLGQNLWDKVDCHFDIISIYQAQGQEKIEHIRDAF